MWKFICRWVVVALGISTQMKAEDSVPIHVKVLDAKNGKPVAKQQVSMQLKGAKGNSQYWTDDSGSLTIEIGRSAEVWVSTSWWVTCRNINSLTPHWDAIDLVVKDGVTVDNTCGKAKSEPIKGELIIFARKPTLAEMLGR